MTALSSQQHRDLLDAYANRLLDDMDLKDLMQFAYDTIQNNLEQSSDVELLDEVYLYVGNDSTEMYEWVKEVAGIEQQQVDEILDL